MFDVHLAIFNYLDTGLIFLRIAEYSCMNVFHRSVNQTLDYKVAVRYWNLNNVYLDAGWVVHSNYHFNIFRISMGRNRAVKVGRVCSSAPLPVVSFNTRTFCEVRNNSTINWVDGLNAFENSFAVIVGGVLFAGASDSIVVLDYSNYVEQSLFCLQNGLDLLIGGALIN